MNLLYSEFYYIQCGAIIMWSIFSKIPTKDIPQLTGKGELWSVFVNVKSDPCSVAATAFVYLIS